MEVLEKRIDILLNGIRRILELGDPSWCRVTRGDKAIKFAEETMKKYEESLNEN